jgi:hypothetical protein
MRDGIKALFPPGVPVVAQWRLATFAGVFVLFMFAAWALGAFRAWGFGEGFAHAENVRLIGDQISTVQFDLLESALFEVRSKQCHAIEQRNQEKKIYAEKLRDLQKRYRAITHSEWRIPDCDEL